MTSRGSNAERAWLGFITPPRATLIAVCGACFLAVFWRWFVAQHLFTQAKLQDWGHAYLIPFISGYLLYLNRKELAAVRPATFWPGLAPLTLGILAYFFGIVGVPNHMVQGFSMILALFGLVLLLGGPGVMRYAFLPIAFLVFGVTLPERVMIDVETQLKFISAEGGWIVLQLVGPIFGFSAVLSGTTIDIIENSGATHQMGIADACSGMRMVIAFVALAGAVALLGCDRWWQRAALVMLAIPVAVFMNIIRIGVLGVGMLWDDQIATGDIHIFIGTVLLVPALGLFMLVRVGLERLFVEDKPSKPAKKSPAPRPAYLGTGWAALRAPACIASVLLMVVSAATMTWAITAWKIHYRKEAIQAEGGRKFMAAGEIRLPTWEVKKTVRENHETEETLGTTNYLTAVYEGTGPGNKGLTLSFHGAYYTGMIDTVPHVPERCLVNSGWMIAGGPWQVTLPLVTTAWKPDTSDPIAKAQGVLVAPIRRTDSLKTTYVRMPAGLEGAVIQVTEFTDPSGKSQYSGYFFIANGRVATTANDVRRMAFDLSSIYAYYAKIQVTSWTAKSPEEFASQAASLLSELLPEVMLCVPDWVEVEAGRYPKENPGASEPAKKS